MLKAAARGPGPSYGCEGVCVGYLNTFSSQLLIVLCRRGSIWLLLYHLCVSHCAYEGILVYGCQGSMTTLEFLSPLIGLI